MSFFINAGNPGTCAEHGDQGIVMMIKKIYSCSGLQRTKLLYARRLCVCQKALCVPEKIKELCTGLVSHQELEQDSHTWLDVILNNMKV